MIDWEYLDREISTLKWIVQDDVAALASIKQR
jgi:hypothetical protein